MEDLMRLGDVVAAAEGDGQLIWAAQGRPDGSLGPGVRAWRHGGAQAVASPDISGRDRLAVRGGRADAAVLVRRVLAEAGPSYRLFGEAELIDALVAETPGLVPLHEFYWMETASCSASPAGAGPARARWLDAGQESRAAALFDLCFPTSHAQPGRSGIRRWAGVLGEVPGSPWPGPLAVAADAWSATGCGFMAGVVTHPAARGRGLARDVCGFLVNALVEAYGRAALMVDGDNPSAVAVYERTGMARRLFRAAYQATPGKTVTAP